MNKMKNLSIALIALGLSTPVLAECPFDVTIPNQQGGFTIGADALYLRPSSPNLTFETVDSFTTTGLGTTNIVTNRNTDNSRINPSFHWGFDVFAEYRFPCTGNDVMATWTHLGETSDSKTAVQGSSSVASLNPGTTVPIITQINYANYVTDSTAKFRYDAVDLNFGQKVNFGSRFLFRVFAGARYADLKQEQDANINRQGTIISFNSRTGDIVLPTTPFSTGEKISETSDFQGIGPEVGMEGRYCIGAGFGADVSAITSVLLGHVDSTEDDNTRTTFITVTQNTNHHSDNNHTIHAVPTLDINLGLDYTYNFNNCSRSSLVIQGGYKVIHYWDVTHFVNNGNIVGNVNDATGVNFDGPYLGLKINV